MNKDTQRVVFFDLETTGLQWWPRIGQLAMPGTLQEIIQPHPIIQVGAAAFNADTQELLDKFSMKVKFKEKDATPEALKLNHYDPDVWAREGIDPGYATSRFKAFLDENATEKKISKAGKDYWVAVLGGHNVSNFDMPFIRQWMIDHNRFFPASYFVLDTMTLAGICKDHFGLHSEDLKLGTVAKALSIEAEGEAHEAAADSVLAGKVYFKLIDLMKGVKL